MKLLKLNAVLLLMLMFVLVSCSTDDEVTDGDMDGATDGDAESTPLVFATYNIGLAVGFVDYADEREPFIKEGVAALDADVVCLQEVWLQEHIDNLLEATKDTFPYSYYEMTTGEESISQKSGEAPCAEDKSQALGDCANTNCEGVEISELAGCVLAECGTEFNDTSSDCQGCIAANLGNTIDYILEACAVAGGSTWAYGGSNGLLMLSKKPFGTKEMHIMSSYLNRRVVLHADIEDNDLGKVDLFCTHLTASLSKIDYHGDYDSWSDEQANQIDTMIAYAKEKSDTRTAVLLGDMNCGPETSNVSSEYPDNYKKFVDAGMYSPYIADDASTCTWCEENPLTGGADSGGEGAIIDHILFLNAPEGASYTNGRILDDEIILDVDGTDTKSRRSDHYGIKTAILP